MIKEAIKYITDLKAEAMEPKVVTIGGLWKNVAMKEIRDYFVRNLESEEDLYKRLTIIA